MMSIFKYSLQCPMPELDFDRITLGHGSGGRLTNRLLDEGVFKLFKSEELAQRHDGAIVQWNGPLAFSTDSFVIDPIFFPGGNIGELAVHGTLNDLAMCGARPRYMSLAFIIEEGLRLDEFWEILLSIESVAQNNGVEIVTGDTKVVDKGKGDKIFINTTGIGELHPDAQMGIGSIKEGDRILLSGSMANHGMAIMAQREGLQFESTIESDTADLSLHVWEMLDRYGSYIKILRDPTRGGVATVLNELAGQSGLGMRIYEDRFPLKKATRSACELLGLDPLYVANEGIFCAIVAPEVAEDVEDWMRNKELSEASLIGEIVTDHPKKLVQLSPLGGKRVVGMLAGDQLPRIC
jgi:hydrogenase expression/formation protein HypE